MNINQHFTLERERQSNFEALRIIAIIMILNSHAFLGQETITCSSLTVNDIFNYLWKSISIGGACLFVLISGYFGIRWKFKGFISLIYQTYFFVFVIYFALLATGVISFSFGDFADRVNCISTAYWFITQYFLLMILAPMLNPYIETASKNQLLFITVSFFIAEFYFCHTGGFGFNGGSSVLNFVGLYLLGRFIKLYCSQSKVSTTSRKAILLCISIVSILILVLTEKIFLHIGGTAFKLYGGALSNPLVILKSLIIFLIIKDIKFTNVLVNKLATIAFPIYLLHMHPDIKYYFYEQRANLYSYSLAKHIYLLVALFAAIIIVSFLLDKLRKLTFDKFYPLLFCWYEIGKNFIVKKYLTI